MSEAVRAQIGHKFEHRLISPLSVEPLGYGMLRGSGPIFPELLELRGGEALSVRHDFSQRPVSAGQRTLE